jgi:hypothetical protein
MKKNDEQLTAEVARQLFTYDDQAGHLRWAEAPCNAHCKGKVAGATYRGYRRIRYLGRKYFEHRLVWLIHTGDWPDRSIDHIDRQKDNNRISNLRLADRYQQMGNTKVSVKNTSGFRGVVWHKRDKKWQASIRVKGKRVHIGLFDNREDAARAYNAAAVSTFGEFYKP